MKVTYVLHAERAIADLVPLGERAWLMTRINVPRASRGEGVGTKLLELVLTDADYEQVVLHLEVAPSDGLGYEALVAWYSRHGFKHRPDTIQMIRQPKSLA